MRSAASPPSADSTVEMTSSYFAGRIIDLTSLSGKSIHVTITQVLSITMSPVMEAQIRTPNGPKKAILKLFDRRFGEAREKHPWDHQAEVAWRECVRTGLAEELLQNLQHHDDKIKSIRLRSDDVDDDDDDEGEEDDDDEDDDDEDDSDNEDDPKKNEAIIYHKNRNFYANEVRAYAELEKLQGKHIPRLLETVIDDSTERPADLPAVYFQVRGILLEYIPSFTLSDMIHHLPNQPHLWTSIVEDAIRMVIEVNKAGVVHFDCQPRNVLVAQTEQGSYQPFLIDFAQCAFRADYRDTPDASDERGFNYLISSSDNRGAIAVLMTKRVARKSSYRLHIQESLLD